MMSDDMTLVWEFATNQSEPAFSALVEQHIALVHSAALRQVGDAHLAEEITQAVFIILARKAPSLGPKTILSAWLYRTTRYAAADALKARRRRQAREQEAHMQSILNQPDADAWVQLAPLLDDALAELGETDRTALVLRFFENKTAREIAGALRMEEAAAQKRVARALEKLRAIFVKRGVMLTVTVIAGAMAANSVQAAPVGLAVTVTAAAVEGVAVGSSTLTIIKGALKIMAWTKAKTTIAVGVGVLLAAGTTTVTVKEIQEHRTYPWQTNGARTYVLDRFPPQVRIVSSKASEFDMASRNDRQIALGASVKDIMAAAYDQGPARVVFSAAKVSGKFDFIANLPSGNHEALQREIKTKFGLVGKLDIRDTEALLLKVKDSAKLQSKLHKAGFTFNDRGFGPTFPDEKLSVVAQILEYFFDKPIVDQTGMDGRYDLKFILNVKSWNDIAANPEGIRETLLNELDEAGLELVPSREPIEMLVVEKVK
jgi:uncharacterized protein (TIGR03435 family)